jgi:hypothetical protein
MAKLFADYTVLAELMMDNIANYDHTTSSAARDESYNTARDMIKVLAQAAEELEAIQADYAELGKAGYISYSEWEPWVYKHFDAVKHNEHLRLLEECRAENRAEDAADAKAEAEEAAELDDSENE